MMVCECGRICVWVHGYVVMVVCVCCLTRMHVGSQSPTYMPSEDLEPGNDLSDVSQ